MRSLKDAVKRCPQLVVWDDSNLTPTYAYKDLLAMAAKYGRIVRFVRWGQELAQQPLHILLKRNILNYLATGKYVDCKKMERAHRHATSSLRTEAQQPSTHIDLARAVGFTMDHLGRVYEAAAGHPHNREKSDGGNPTHLPVQTASTDGKQGGFLTRRLSGKGFHNKSSDEQGKHQQQYDGELDAPQLRWGQWSNTGRVFSLNPLCSLAEGQSNIGGGAGGAGAGIVAGDADSDYGSVQDEEIDEVNLDSALRSRSRARSGSKSRSRDPGEIDFSSGIDGALSGSASFKSQQFGSLMGSQPHLPPYHRETKAEAAVRHREEKELKMAATALTMNADNCNDGHDHKEHRVRRSSSGEHKLHNTQHKAGKVERRRKSHEPANGSVAIDLATAPGDQREGGGQRDGHHAMRESDVLALAEREERLRRWQEKEAAEALQVAQDAEEAARLAAEAAAAEESRLKAEEAARKQRLQTFVRKPADMLLAPHQGRRRSLADDPSTAPAPLPQLPHPTPTPPATSTGDDEGDVVRRGEAPKSAEQLAEDEVKRSRLLSSMVKKPNIVLSHR